jgi:hypothetical protein
LREVSEEVDVAAHVVGPVELTAECVECRSEPDAVEGILGLKAPVPSATDIMSIFRDQTGVVIDRESRVYFGGIKLILKS